MIKFIQFWKNSSIPYGHLFQFIAHVFHLFIQDAGAAAAPPADALQKDATAPATQAYVKTKIL